MKSNSLKVLFVHDGPLYQDSKGNYFGVHFNENLKKRYLFLGDEVTFCMRVETLINKTSGQFSSINPNKFNFISFPNFKTFRSYFKKKPVAKRIIIDAVKNHDILVARMPSASGSIAVKAAEEYGKPYLVEFVACTFDAYWNYSWKGKLIAHYKMYQQKQIVQHLPYIIYVTKFFLQKRYPSLGKQINCSNVELQFINHNDLLTRQHKIENIKWPLTIGTVAALDVPYKGQADVIKAIYLLKKEGRYFKYNLVGQGDPSNLLKLAKSLDVLDMINVIGPLKHEDVFRFYCEIDIYIQPSKQEGLPRALIEAMSKACPAKGACTAGIPELLDSEDIFNPGNVQEIIRHLKSINISWMLKAAERNFQKSQEFEKVLLENRRFKFFNEFLTDHNLRSK